MPQGPLPIIPPGNLKIHASHFRQVRDRIEAIKPLAGDGINLKQTEDGIEISATTATGGGANGVFSLADCAKIIELDICKDGDPSTIYVLGWNTDGELELCGESVRSS